MIMHEFITLVQKQLEMDGVPVMRDLILRRTRQEWPQSIEFKDVQLRLMVDQIKRETGHKPSNVKAISIGKVSRPARILN